MVLAKRTAKNQRIRPKSVVEQVGAADYFNVACANGRRDPASLADASSATVRLALG
jgi:hypothetical protein